jgi:hypothetical protein
MRKPMAYSIDDTLPKRINKIWKGSKKATSASDFVNEVLLKAVVREESKLKPQTHKKG